MHHPNLRSFLTFIIIVMALFVAGHLIPPFIFDIPKDPLIEAFVSISVILIFFTVIWLIQSKEKKIWHLNQKLLKLSQERSQERSLTMTELSKSRESLAKAQRIAHLGNWDWNIQTGELIWSDEIYRIFGLPPQKSAASYEAFLACVHPDDRDRVVDAMNRAVNERKPYFIDHRVVSPDGKTRYVHEQGEVEYDTSGKPLCMSGTMLDIMDCKQREDKIKELNTRLMQRVEQKAAELSDEITVRKAAQKESQSQRAKAERYLAMAGNLLVALDAQGCIEMINEKGAKLLGYDSPLDLMGKDWFEIAIPSHVRSVVRNVFNDIISGTQDVFEEYENEIITRTGQICLMRWHNALVYNDQDQVIGILGSATDITAQKHHETSLMDAKNAAEEANRAKDGFLSNMSHELRTPMNAVLGFAQLLQSDSKNLTESQLDYIAIILQSGEHLMTLVNEILDLSRIEIGVLRVELEDMQLLDALVGATSLLATMAAKRNINIHVADNIEALPIITADKTRLRQVLVNLISNALKYNRENGEVFISANVVPQDMLRITIRDTGHGIPSGRHHELFQPFNRLSAENSGIEGTGVGLVLTQNLIKLMHGNIGFDSAEGLGSTFWIELPISHTELAATNTSISSLPAQLSQTDRLRVFYVEDNPTAIRLMEDIIAQLDGVDLIPITDTKNGLEMIKANPPELMLLNINSPCDDESPIQAWCHQHTPAIPIIAIYECQGVRELEDCKRQLYEGCIDTPVNVDEITHVLRQVLNLPGGPNDNIVPFTTKQTS